MSAHTSGPWFVAPGGSPYKWEVFTRSLAAAACEHAEPEVEEEAVAYVEHGVPAEGRANAELISAAPELLEALKTLADRVDPGTKQDRTIQSFVAALKKARSALSKAGVKP